MNAPSLPAGSWDEALVQAARLLPQSPGNLLFHEEREDLRIELSSPGESPRISLTRVRGAAARNAAGRVLHRSDPTVEDLEGLAGGSLAVSRKSTAVETGPSRLDATVPTGMAIDLAARIHRTGAGMVTHLSILWVELVQRVWVLRVGQMPRSDVRRARRLKVTASANGWPRAATATFERVFRGDSPVAVEDIAEALIRRLRQRLTARPVRTGGHPIVFAAGAGGVVFHELVGHALEADTILRGGSLLHRLSRADGRIAAEHFTVIDDPRRGRVPWRWDDEGEEATAVALVREGRVVGAMHDVRSAHAMNKTPTGHGRAASYASGVRPRMGCTFLAPGPLDPREVIESTAAGIHVRRMESAGTDPSTGVAFFRVSDADWIESGRIEGPLDPFLLRVRLPEALASIDRIACDLEFDRCVGSCVRDGQALATSVGAPTYRLGVATTIR